MDIRIVDGRLTRDAEVKTNHSGTKFLSFTLANNGFAKGEQITTFFNVISYNPYDIQRQENDGFYNKGRLVIVSGRPSESMSIKDNKTYLNRNIIANSIELGAYSVNKENTSTTTYKDVAPTPMCETPQAPKPQVPQPDAPTYQQPTTSANQQPQVQQTVSQKPTYNVSMDDDDNDLPF